MEGSREERSLGYMDSRRSGRRECAVLAGLGNSEQSMRYHRS